jgi:8-oxo-dGTP diphosphatase
MNNKFSGAKIALLVGEQMLTYRRAGTTKSYWGYIDLPGGSRDGSETAVECAIRELHEEIGLTLLPEDFCWHQEFVGDPDHPSPIHIFAARASPERMRNFQAGTEGTDWQFMSPIEFVNHPEAIPYLRRQIRTFLNSI